MIFPKKALTVALIVIAIGVLVFFVFIKKGTEAEGTEASQDAPESEAKETPIPVKVAKAYRGELIITLKSPGEAVTNRMVIIKSEVEGVIKKIDVEEGQHVEEGDLLIELDDRRYRLELERSQADRLSRLSELLMEKQFAGTEEDAGESGMEKIQRAKQEYESARELFQKGMISEKEYEDIYRKYELAVIESGEKKDEVRSAMKGLTQAEIAVKKAQMDLERTKIRAPFSGIITDIQVSPQEHISGGRDLFFLVNISRIQVHAKVLESEIGKMKVGREVDLRFSAYPGRVFKGKVKAISPVINPEDKTCKVIVAVDNPKEEIKPGMHADVEIAAEIHKDKLLVPQDAVLVRGGRKLAFVVEGDLAKWRYIQVGLENDEFAEVLPSDREGEGVKEGEIVIIDGHFTLAHDARIRIEED
ncbi:MAG: efflux RND transporter periplasmic adaptor subunit [Candidatus Aminicenantes bacterium]|nr:efflux RND transporter periplasmic adaptor subunit [Candidatus Aminicenantes bacterium]